MVHKWTKNNIEEQIHGDDVAEVSTQVGGAQAIARAMQVLRGVSRACGDGAGLLALTRDTGLSKPTVHRILAACAEGMVEQESVSRRYFLGPECHVLGNVASERFGINRLAAPVVARLAHECGDSAFFSIRRDVFAVCVLREDGDYPLKTHVLLPGDRHPLGVGAGSLAILAALPDDEVDACLQANAALIARRYPHYSVPLIRALVDESRERGYSVNQGLVVPGSWGLGVRCATSRGMCWARSALPPWSRAWTRKDSSSWPSCCRARPNACWRRPVLGGGARARLSPSPSPDSAAGGDGAAS